MALDNNLVANNNVANNSVVIFPTMKKGGSNWVDGDKFFNRDAELEVLAERAEEGIHSLITAPRRMGKTSLVRESLRRLSHSGQFDAVFVDLEAARDPADAIAEIAAQSKAATGAWNQVKRVFNENLRELADRVDSVSAASVQVQLRAGIAAGNRWRKGDELFAALAEGDRPVLLAIDELPILVNRLLQGDGQETSEEGRKLADEFLSWLRKNGQTHQGNIVIVLSGSVGLEPILRRAGLSAHANIYQPLLLKPWEESVALGCLEALAIQYKIQLSLAVRKAMCHRLRYLIPHHVQQFFDHMHVHLRREGRVRARKEDVDLVYSSEMLSVRGQVHMQHYETRLDVVLATPEYKVALEFLTEAAVCDGLLSNMAISEYRRAFEDGQNSDSPVPNTDEVLDLLEQDGYLSRDPDGYRLLSGYLQDWWLARHGSNFVPILKR